MQFLRCVAVTTCLMLAASLAQAQGAGSHTQARAQEIVAQQKQIRADLQAGAEQYRHLDGMRRGQIYAAQRKVFRLLEGHETLAELSTDDQLAVFNALKLIESHMVKHDEDDRMVCERVALAGTRRYAMACMTEADRREKADEVRAMLQERAACTTRACISGD